MTDNKSEVSFIELTKTNKFIENFRLEKKFIVTSICVLLLF